MQDRYGHRISYLRVSITDRCNERCGYCMPQELQEWLPRHAILTYEETLRLIRIAAELGVSKLRITGGEPLTRRGIVDFVRQIPEIRRITSIGLSTNGTLLGREIAPAKTMAEVLRDAGVQSVNISLDTLNPTVYARITGRDFHAQVLDGIDAAIAARFYQIKLNAVLMRGRNEDQLLPLIEFAVRGLGVIYVPTFMIKPQLESGALVQVLRSHMPRDLWVFAVYAQRQFNSAALRSFIDFLAAGVTGPAS